MKQSNNLYKITTDDHLEHVPTWAIGFSYNDEEVEVAWCDIKILEGVNKGYSIYGFRVFINGERAREDKINPYIAAARQIRRLEVYEELFDDKNIDEIILDSKSERIADKIENLFKRAENGEFIGQYRDMLYVQEAAEILKVSEETAIKVINEILIPQKRIGLSGMILIEWDKYDKNKKILKERTGHKNISISDFGYWYCDHCKKSGDEYDSPKDFECIINASK